MNTAAEPGSLFPKGEKAPEEYFTGTVWVKLLVPNDQAFNTQIGNVVFESGARNNWHTHPGGRYSSSLRVLVIIKRKESPYR